MRLERRELAALLAVVLVAALLRFLAPGADIPWETERTNAPVQDAFWYLEGAAGPAEGSHPEPLPVYDLPVWTSVARVWFALAGVSLGSAQALGGLISLASLLLFWRIARAGLGPRAALGGTAVLAVLYPWVALSRTALIYGPVTLVLLVAAAIWLGSRRFETRWRLALEGTAWVLVLGTALVVRPPAAALAGGLFLGTLARYPRSRAPLLTLTGLGALFLAAILIDTRLLSWVIETMKDMGGAWRENAWRLGRYVPHDLTLGEVCCRLLQWGAEPNPGLSQGRELLWGRGSGFLALAPGALGVASLGVLCALHARDRTDRERETLLVFGGWALLFVLASLLLDYRPLRYFMLLAPPIAVFAGYVLPRAFVPSEPPVGSPLDRLREAGLLQGLTVAAWGALAWPHLLDLLGLMPHTPALRELMIQWHTGQGSTEDLATRIQDVQAARDARLFTHALTGGLLGLLVWGVWTALPRPRARVVGALVLLLALVPSTVRSAAISASPTWSVRVANQTAGEVLPHEAVVAGPSAPFVTFGHGRQRYRAAGWLKTGDRHIEAAIAGLQERGCTHLALDLTQIRAARVVPRFQAQGVELQVVAVLSIRRPGTPGSGQVWIVIFRLPPHLLPKNYQPSPYELDQDQQTPNLRAARDRVAIVRGLFEKD